MYFVADKAITDTDYTQVYFKSDEIIISLLDIIFPGINMKMFFGHISRFFCFVFCFCF